MERKPRGDTMAKKNDKGERIYPKLTPEQTKRLNNYCLAMANKQGKMPYAIKTKILRKAIEEWLDKHEKDLTIQF